MAEASRSLSACLRCRKKKLKCGGPSEVPCRRCRTSRAECVFVAPKAIRTITTSTESPDDHSSHARHLDSDRFALLERRLDRMEERHRAEIQEMQRAVAQLTAAAATSSSSNNVPGVEKKSTSSPGQLNESCTSSADIVARGIVSQTEWEELYDFYHDNCRDVVGFMDDQIYAHRDIVRQHPLMSTVICMVAARAIRPEKYQRYLAEADELIKNSFSGPTPDIQAVRAMMLLTAWTGRARLWGYVAAISAELGLNTAALQLGDDAVEHTSGLVQRARVWFTLCCYDLSLNVNRPFVINRMREYLPFAKSLLTSPFSLPVDHRICAYIVGFTITADAKAQLPKSQLQLNPLRQEEIDLLTSFDQRIDRWFHKLNNTIDPVYQTFGDKQDRNRFIMPYTFMKVYINGFALHGMPLPGEVPDPNRIRFVQKALDNATLLIQAQFQSHDFRRRFRYTIEYNGVTTYHAINFILTALPAAHRYLDCRESFKALRHAALMFEEAGAVEAAREVRRERERVALLTQNVLSLTEDESPLRDPAAAAIDDATLFDLPSFLDDATWNESFPTLDMYFLD